MKLNLTKPRTLAAFATVAMMASGAAIAQQPTTPPATQQAQPQIDPVSDAEISQFAAANAKVGTIASDMNSQLEGVESADQVNEIQATAQQEMVTAIEQEGLTPTRYTEIVQLAQLDPEVMQKIETEIDG